MNQNINTLRGHLDDLMDDIIKADEETEFLIEKQHKKNKLTLDEYKSRVNKK